MKIKKILTVALCAVMATGCVSSFAAAEDELTWKIGVIGPLTGDYAQYGLGVYRAAQIAVDEINAEGGINGYQVELLPGGDDQGDPELAINAYNNLLDQGMQMLDGTVTSAPSISVSAEADGTIFMMTPSATAEEAIIGADSYQFRMCFTDPMQGGVSAQYIADNGLAETVAILYDSAADYNVGIHNSFLETAEEVGLEVVADLAYTTDSNTDFSVQLSQIKDSGAELLFLPNYYNDNALILQQAADINLDIQYFGVDGMDGILAVENFDTSLAEDVMLLLAFASTSTDDITVNFVDAYKEAFNDDPNQFAGDSYDVIYAMKAAAEAADVTPDMSNEDIAAAMSEAMLSISVEGLTGVSTWMEDGNCSKAPNVYVIKDGLYQKLD